MAAASVSHADLEALTELFDRLGHDCRSKRGRPPRVTVIGNYGNGNTGDDAILAGIAELADGHAQLSAVVADPDRLVAPDGVAIVRRESSAGLRTLLSSDVVAIGGGGMFGGGMPWKVELLPWVALALAATRHKVVFLAVGAYSDMPSRTRLALQLLGRYSYAVTARDESTARLLSARFKRSSPPALVVPDPAKAVRAASVGAVAAHLGVTVETLEGRLCLSLKPTPDAHVNGRMVNAAAEAATMWAQATGRGVIYLCLSEHGDFGLGATLTDRILAEQAIARTHETAVPALIAGPNLPPVIAKGLVGASSAIVSARLHALIFASDLAVSAFALLFEKKTAMFARAAGVDGVDLTQATLGSLPAWLAQRSSSSTTTGARP